MSHDVVRELADQALAVVARDPRLLFEPAADLGAHLGADARLLEVAGEQLTPEFVDQAEMDPVLDLRERVGSVLGRRRGQAGETLVQLHRIPYLPLPNRRRRPFEPLTGASSAR